MTTRYHFLNLKPSDIARMKSEVYSSDIAMNEIAADLIEFLTRERNRVADLDEVFCVGAQLAWLYDMFEQDTVDIIDALRTNSAIVFLQGANRKEFAPTTR